MTNNNARQQAASRDWPPHLTVAVIVQKDDKFLMVEEIDQDIPVINQPAGHLEPGESLFDAAIRETLEETAWRVELQNLVGIYHYLSPHNGVTYHRICFSARPLEDTASRLDPDIIRAAWMTLTEIEGKKLRSPLVTACIDDYLKGQAQPLSFIKHY